jgi:hypothetical protein
MRLGLGLGLNKGQSAGVPTDPPVNTVAPALSGNFFVGQTLTCSTGSWSGAPTSYSYNWKNNGVSLGATDQNTYVLQSGDNRDTITCTVTATNAAGSATATSNGLIALLTTAWYDASDTSSITHVAGSVSQWNDKSGNGFHLTQATGSRQPITGTRTLNGLNVLDFQDAQVLSITSAMNNIGNGANTAFCVAMNDTTNSYDWYYNANSNDIGLNRNGSSIRALHSVAFTLNSLLLTANTDPHVVGHIRNGTNLSAFYDGNVDTADAIAEDIAITNFNIGSEGNGGSNGLDGIIGSFIWFQFELTTAEMNQVGNMLKTKWGTPWTNIP